MLRSLLFFHFLLLVLIAAGVGFPGFLILGIFHRLPFLAPPGPILGSLAIVVTGVLATCATSASFHDIALIDFPWLV